jgi:class 3 adenylate cyclase
VQALFVGEEQAVAQCTIAAAIGLQSAMEGPIKKCLPQADSLHLAIGVDLGMTLVSRLGVRNYRDPICLGQAVERAAAFEEVSSGRQIAVSHRLYRALPGCIRCYFQWSGETHCYIATDLTMMRLEKSL